MQVYLLRHGIAEDQQAGKSDAQRQLTPKGIRKLKDVLKQASTYEVAPSLILSSPLVRARQTADVAAGELAYKESILETTSLIPEASPEQVWDELRVHRDEREVMLIGHEPLFSSLYAFLLNSPTLAVQVRKGSIGRIEIDAGSSKPRGVLRWMLVPRSE
jgi:phosphohistidine phosphatase